MNVWKPLISASSGTDDVTAAAQEEIGAIIHTGAAVASIDMQALHEIPYDDLLQVS